MNSTCIIFRLYYTFAAGTDTKNCHKVRSISMHDSCFNNLDILHISMFSCLNAQFLRIFILGVGNASFWIEVGTVIISNFGKNYIVLCFVVVH